MKIITISGHRNSAKVKLAENWDKNANVTLVNPVTTNMEREDFIRLKPSTMKMKIEEEKPLVETCIGDDWYYYFESQLCNDWNIFILDDLCLHDLKENFTHRFISPKRQLTT